MASTRHIGPALSHGYPFWIEWGREPPPNSRATAGGITIQGGDVKMTTRQGTTRSSFVIAVLCALLCGIVGITVAGQEIQTPSSVIPETIALVDGAAALADEQKTTLGEAFEAAAVDGYIADTDGVALVEASGLPLLVEGDDPAGTLDAIYLVLEAITTGQVDPEGAITALAIWAANDAGLDALSGLLDEQATPEGIINALDGAFASAGFPQTASTSVFAQIELLIEAGVPPGIALRVTRQTVRDVEEFDEQFLLDQLILLGELIADGTSAGLAANDVTEHGKSHNRHQEEEQEENENEVQGVPPGQQKEKENNANENANPNSNKP